METNRAIESISADAGSEVKICTVTLLQLVTLQHLLTKNLV